MDYSDINIIRLEEDEKIETKFTPTVNHQFTKEDLVIDSRVTSMSVNLDLPNSFDYKEEYYKKYMEEL